MNYIDLFSGIGGFALGAYLAGMKFENHFYSEIDKYCCKLYQLRFPDSIGLGDITKIDCEKLKEDYPGEWIITGGFPCQDISIAGKGVGIHGKRSGLWFEMWRIIRILRPRFVIAENVSAITFRGFDRVLGSLAEIGYNAEWQDIRASDMGAPHRRERIWIVAYPECKRGQSGMLYSKNNIQTLSGKKTNTFITGSKRLKIVADTSSKRLSKREEKKKQEQLLHAKRGNIEISNTDSKRFKTGGPAVTQKCKKTDSMFRNSDKPIGKYSGWSVEPSMGRLANGVSGRVDRLKGLGNSIVPQIAELLFNRIREVL